MLKIFGFKEWIHDHNYDMCEMMSYTVFDKKFVTDNICIKLVSYSTHSYPYFRSYPYSNSKSNKNIKTNMISVISVHNQFDYISNLV
jgi:hypothetical protein